MKRILEATLAALLVLGNGCGEGTGGTLGGLDATLPGPDAVEQDSPVGGADLPLADGQECRPGEARCMGSIFLVCNAAGSDWMSVPCPDGQACTPTGCKGVPGQDVIGADDVPAQDATPPVEDTAPPADTVQPTDTAPGQDTNPGVDVPGVPDTVEPVDPGPPANCGNNPPCAADRECCDTPMGLRCVPLGACGGPPPQGCQTDQDCGPGQSCCPGDFPGAPSQCAASCGGTGTLPTCQSDGDCTGGQTCFSIFGNNNYCLSTCTADADCNGQACKDVGAFGYSLGQVCDCAQDGDCGEGLVCCDIPYVGQYLGFKTCLTQCM